MGKLRQFHVYFDNEIEVFHPGDVISGNVVLELEESKVMRGIYMEFKGKSDVHWSEQEGTTKQKHSVYFTSHEEYFNQRLIIYGFEDGMKNDSTVTLQRGEYKFPFHFTLPSKPLPCSFEGELGYVRYSINTVIDRPWKFDHVTRKVFTVADQPYDLNQVPQAMIPLRAEDEKIVCCCCCATGPITLLFNIDRKAYVPGECISISSHLDNNSNRSVHDTQAELIQSVTYWAHKGGVHGVRHYRTLSRTITTLKGEGCDQHGKVTWENRKLRIPPLPASELRGCDFIDIKYYVTFSADVTATPFDMDLTLQIIIGTIPLQCLYTPINGQDTSATSNIELNDIQPQLATLPNKSYSSCTHGAREIKDRDDDYVLGDRVYTPRYIYYNWDAHHDASHH